MQKFEIKHTPGPWEVSKRDGRLDIRQTKKPGIFGYEIAEAIGGMKDDTHKANALLIAASPLLLSALIKAVEDIGETYPEADVFTWYNEALSAIAAAGVTITQVDDTNVADLKTTQP